MQALKKLVRLSVKNSEQKSTIHQTDDFQIEKTVDMWVKVFSSSVLDSD